MNRLIAVCSICTLSVALNAQWLKQPTANIPPKQVDPALTQKEDAILNAVLSEMQKHGGLLQYQTRLNHGTTFGIVLPQVTT